MFPVYMNPEVSHHTTQVPSKPHKWISLQICLGSEACTRWTNNIGRFHTTIWLVVKGADFRLSTFKGTQELLSAIFDVFISMAPIHHISPLLSTCGGFLGVYLKACIHINLNKTMECLQEEVLHGCLFKHILYNKDI